MGEVEPGRVAAYVESHLQAWRSSRALGARDLSEVIQGDDEFASLGVCGAFHGPTPDEFRALISGVADLSESERSLIGEALALACFHCRAKDDPVMKVLRWVTQPLREGRRNSQR